MMMSESNSQPVENKSKELSYEQKIVIMEKLIPFAGQLFEKWNEGLDRESQHTLWNSLAEGCRMDGISFENGIALKNRVRNWVNRAEKCEETMNSIGYARKTKLTYLQKLCIDFIHAAKGKDIVKSTSTGIDSKSCDDFHQEVESPSTEYETYTLKPAEAEGCRESELRQYYLLLQCIELERKLGLNQQDVVSIRTSISPSLNDLPSSTSHDMESMTVEYLEE